MKKATLQDQSTQIDRQELTDCQKLSGFNDLEIQAAQPESECTFEPEVVPQTESYSLNKELRKAGHELSEIEALMLDVARISHKGFKRGVATHLRTVKRFMRAYHWAVCSDHNIGR
ncbi:MAG: hypothetical protein ABJZ55_10185 [Fuerstiella sp.]